MSQIAKKYAPGCDGARNDTDDCHPYDFLIRSLFAEKLHKLEVKSDWKAMETGNVAIEVVKNMEDGTPGWGYKIEADTYVFFLIDAQEEPYEAIAITGKVLRE